jgi:stage IV sporulation protein FB
LFTIAGIPISASPFYFLLLLMFSRGDWMNAIIWAVCITVSLLAHELGHALVARHLRHDPSIMLHGFGGLTSRTRTGRDVEEAAIIAMGPAAGLALGLLIFGLWWSMAHAGLSHLAFSQRGAEILQAFLYPCFMWNLLNLIPLWPLDGGQLFRLGVLRFTRGRLADRITHGLSLVLIAGLGVWAFQTRSIFGGIVLFMLAAQNIRALRGEESSGPTPQRESEGLSELMQSAQKAFGEGRFKDAARFAQQARALDRVSPGELEKIWELLGLANMELGEYDEALAYLRRAPVTPATREATRRCLEALGREAEPEQEYRVVWQGGNQGRYMNRWLIAALSFIVVALTLLFSTSLSVFVF